MKMSWRGVTGCCKIKKVRLICQSDFVEVTSTSSAKLWFRFPSHARVCTFQSWSRPTSTNQCGVIESNALYIVMVGDLLIPNSWKGHVEPAILLKDFRCSRALLFAFHEWRMELTTFRLPQHKAKRASLHFCYSGHAQLTFFGIMLRYERIQ